MGAGDPDRRVPSRRSQDLAGPRRRATALADREQAPDQGAHHAVAEGVRPHGRLEGAALGPVLDAHPGQPSSVRIVVAPARRRQNAAKSWAPSSSSAASFIASTSSACGHTSTWLRTSGSTSETWSTTR